MKRFALSGFWVLLVSILLLGQSTFGQTQPSQGPLRDTQAIAVLQASVTAMGGALPSDSVACGTVQIVAGSQTSSGTIRILTRGDTQTSEEVTTADGVRKVIYANGQADEIVAGITHSLPFELAFTSRAPDFPLPLLLATIGDSNWTVQYIGLESFGAISLHHIRSWVPSAMNVVMNVSDDPIAALTARDIWIDVSSKLPYRISYTRRAALVGVPVVPIEISFSDYRSSSGVVYPYMIRKSLNGTPWTTITISTVSFNNGLTDADFPIQ